MRRLVAVSTSQPLLALKPKNYMEPNVEEPLAEEEWLQNGRIEQEDKEGLARELN